VRDAFINGLASPAVPQKLLEKDDHTLEAAFEQDYSLDRAQPRTPERGCITGVLPPLAFERGATGAQLPLHTSVVNNFMIYHYQFETNSL